MTYKPQHLLLLLAACTIVCMAWLPLSKESHKVEANAPTVEKIQWMTMEEAYKASQTKPKKLFIDIYTDWCGWCKKLDSETFSNPEVAKLMTENYYPVKLDGEGKEDIVLGGQTYSFVNEGKRGYHQLAAALMQGKMSYPTMVIYDLQANIGESIVGYKDATGLKAILEKNMLSIKPLPKQTAQEQQSLMETVLKGSKTAEVKEANAITAVATDKIKWMSMEEAHKAMQKKPKKLLIDVYTDWCGWCKKMDKGTFSDPELAKYINEHFYAVKLDAEQKEAIELGDQVFVYQAGANGKGYNQLAQVLLKQKMSFPTIVVAGDRFDFYHPYSGYREVAQMKEILDFYVQGKHLNKP
jgi:thioredoxin-related protein